MNLKHEINWLDKVQRNFKEDDDFHSWQGQTYNSTSNSLSMRNMQNHINRLYNEIMVNQDQMSLPIIRVGS